MPLLTVMTFNVRYDEPADGRHAWPNRRGLVAAAIRASDPDLIGLQEPSANQWDDLASDLPGWLPFGDPRADEDDYFDRHGGFIKASRFDVRAGGRFWLSDTPHVAGSVSWANDWGPRACGWARLSDRFAGRDLIFASTHLDTNAGAWLPSARVLRGELDEIARGSPVILVGDFNCAAGSEAHAYLLEVAGFRDAWIEAGHSNAGVVTFNGFTTAIELPDEPDSLTDYPADVRQHRNCRIDWILLRGPLACAGASIDYRHEGGLMPSDHYPVTAVVSWEG